MLKKNDEYLSIILSTNLCRYNEMFVQQKKINLILVSLIDVILFNETFRNIASLQVPHIEHITRTSVPII